MQQMLPRRYAGFLRQNATEEADATFVTPCDLKWRAAYAASMTLAVVDMETRGEQCIFGHSHPVEILELSDDGLWAASVQGAVGATPTLIRLWHVEPSNELSCVSVLSCPVLMSIRAVAFDAAAKHLAVAGLNQHSRQQLLAWDISKARGGGNITLMARQMAADWDIDALKFSPFEALRLVTCGRENIRFWRIKEGHLPGCSVVLNSLARQTHFTCIAFEYNKMSQPHFLGESLTRQHRCYVGTATGKLIQLSYNDRTVQAVFDLHSEAILDLCANESFVVSASADKYVRVWPLDFNSFYLHAMHDAPVTGVDITADGMKIICSTSEGTVGILNLKSHEYLDMVHSHKANIVDIAASLHFSEVATISTDGALKVWSLPLLTQMYEFNVSEDTLTCLAFHPADRHIIATGSSSGTLRVFDVEGLTMVYERRNHVQPIRSIAAIIMPDCVPKMDLPFCPDHLLRPLPAPHFRAVQTRKAMCQLVLCDASGGISFHDEARDFELVRCPEQVLSLSPPDGCPAMVCVPPVLVKYADPHTLAIFSFPDLNWRRSLRPPGPISTFSLTLDAQFVVIGMADGKLQVAHTATGHLAYSTSFANGPLQSVVMTTLSLPQPHSGVALLLTSANDGVVRISELKRSCPNDEKYALSSDPLGEQSFIGHARAPHRILLASNMVVSASSCEVLAWATTGSYFASFCEFAASLDIPSQGQGGDDAQAVEAHISPRRPVLKASLPTTEDDDEPWQSQPIQGDRTFDKLDAKAEEAREETTQEANVGLGTLTANQVVDELRMLAEADDLERWDQTASADAEAAAEVIAADDIPPMPPTAFAETIARHPKPTEASVVVGLTPRIEETAFGKVHEKSKDIRCGLLAHSVGAAIIVEHLADAPDHDPAASIHLPGSIPLCQIQASTLCTSIAFLSQGFIIAAFLDGSLCIFNVASYTMEARVGVTHNDPLMAMQQLSPSSVLVGTAKGALIVVRLGTYNEESRSNDSQAKPLVRAQRTTILSAEQSMGLSAVTSLVADSKKRCGILVACFASLRLRVMEHYEGSEGLPRHKWTWVWPETLPLKPEVDQSRLSTEDCSNLLSKPPLVTCFLVIDGNPLLLVTAPPSQCLYVYSCTTGAVMNRVSFADELRLVSGMWSTSPPLSAEGPGTETVVLLCYDRMSLLTVSEGGTKATWISEAPREESFVGSNVGVPAVCCISNQVGGCGVIAEPNTPFNCWAVCF